MFRKFAIVIGSSFLICSSGWAQSAASQITSATPSSDSEHARVFITDSQSWEVHSSGGGNWAGFGSESHGGARPQTAEIIKTFAQRCPDVITNNIQQKADYVVVLDHEGGKQWGMHRNKVAVFTRVSGDSIVSKSTLSLGGSVQEACEGVEKNWAKNSASIREAEAKELAAREKLAAPPQIQQVAQSGATKLSIVSNPAAADIEVDGGFVGNTPSSVEVATGDHTITVSKSGYKTWERKLKANGGNVNINAELEAEGK